MLEAAGLTLNLSKCNMLQKSITFLGHVVSAEGVRTETTKVEAVQNVPVPTTLKEVQCFYGLTGWFHRFIPHFSRIATLLHSLKNKNVSWEWTMECQQAFDKLKKALPMLVPPDFTKSPDRCQCCRPGSCVDSRS